MTKFQRGDAIAYHDQKWEVTVTPSSVPMAFIGEELVWAYRLPEKTILRYFKPDEITKVEDIEEK